MEAAERMTPVPQESGHRLTRALELLMRMALVGGVCFILSWAAVSVTRTTGSVAAIWPATAILLAVLLRSPPARWPAYLLAGYVASCAANLVYGDNLLLATGLPLGNVVETLVAAIFLRRSFPQGVDLRDIRQLVAVVVIAMLAATACGATIGAGLLDMVHSGNFWRSWFNWWTGVGTGILLIVPLILAWPTAARDGAPKRIARPLESAGALLCAVCGAALLFSQQTISDRPPQSGPGGMLVHCGLLRHCRL